MGGGPSISTRAYAPPPKHEQRKGKGKKANTGRGKSRPAAASLDLRTGTEFLATNGPRSVNLSLFLHPPPPSPAAPEDPPRRPVPDGGNCQMRPLGSSSRSCVSENHDGTGSQWGLFFEYWALYYGGGFGTGTRMASASRRVPLGRGVLVLSTHTPLRRRASVNGCE